MLVSFGQHLNPIIAEIIKAWNNKNDKIVRVIEYEFRLTSWGSVVKQNGKEERNNILQKALTLYIAEQLTVKLDTGNVSLMAVQEKGKRDEDSWEMVYGSTAEQLKQYSVNILPPMDTWVTLKPYLEFMQSNGEEEESKGGGEKNTNPGPKKQTTLFSFKTDRAHGEKYIDDFIKEAFNWYVEKVSSQQDFSRYLYMLVKSPPAANSEGNNDEAPSRLYKRYKLSDEKTFQSLFFPEKDMLLKLLSHFNKKTGKYAIHGFPHKGIVIV